LAREFLKLNTHTLVTMEYNANKLSLMEAKEKNFIILIFLERLLVWLITCDTLSRTSLLSFYFFSAKG
jgi:hypothetical protein